MALSLACQVRLSIPLYSTFADCQFLYIALVFYEYIITLGEEIEIVWKKRWNAATILFIINRYLMVVYNAAGNVVATNAEVRLGQIYLDQEANPLISDVWTIVCPTHIILLTWFFI